MQKQVYEWLHVRQVESFEEMTNLSFKTLRRDWMRPAGSSHSEKEQVQISKLDGTRKYLFYWKTEMSLRVC